MQLPGSRRSRLTRARTMVSSRVRGRSLVRIAVIWSLAIVETCAFRPSHYSYRFVDRCRHQNFVEAAEAFPGFHLRLRRTLSSNLGPCKEHCFPSSTSGKSRAGSVPHLSKISSENESEPSSDATTSITNVLRRSIVSLYNGISIPFPSLRRLILLRKRGKTEESTRLALGMSLQQGVLFVLAYLIVGVASYSFVLEKWSLLDALYFSCVCFSTVGYGDLCPSTATSKLFTCVFGLGGIAFLGTAIATIGSSVLEAEVNAVKKAKRQSKQRVMRLFEGMTPKKLGKGRQMRERMLKKQALRRRINFSKQLNDRSKFISEVLVRVLPALSIVVVGGVIMSYLNGSSWSLADSLYYGIVTASTIGFGDLGPQTRAAKAFAIVYIPLSVAAAGDVLSAVAVTMAKRRQREVYEKQLKKDLTIEHLKAMDTDGDGQITREEYVEFMLLEMGLVSRDELNELYEQFDRLDITRSGYLDKEDLRLMAELRGAWVEGSIPAESNEK